MTKRKKCEVEMALTRKKRRGPRKAEDWYISPEEVEDAPYLKAGSKGKTEPVLNWNKVQGGEQQDGSTGAGLEQQKGLEGAGAEGKGVVEHDAKNEGSSDLDSLFRESPEVENGPDNGNNHEGNDETTKQSATDSLIKRSSSNTSAQKHEASSPVEEEFGADVGKTTDVNMAEPKARDTSKKPGSENESSPIGGATRNALTAVKLLHSLNSALEKDQPLQKHDIPQPMEAETKHRSSKRKIGDAELCEAGPSGGKHKRPTRDTKKLAEKLSTERCSMETKSESQKPSKMANNKAPAKKYAQLRAKVSRP